MNRSHLLGLLAGAAAATVAAVPAFAEEKSEKKPEKPEAAEKRAEAALSALAKRHGAEGTVKSVDADKKSFVLTTKQGDLTVTTNADTKYRAPHEEHPTFASIKKDQRVAVQGERPNDTTLLASHVNILPTKEELEQRREELKKKRDEEHAKRMVTVGTTSNVSTGADGKGGFSVTPEGGSAVTFVVNADTVYTLRGVSALANGQRARVVSTKNDAGQNVARTVHVPAPAKRD